MTLAQPIVAGLIAMPTYAPVAQADPASTQAAPNPTPTATTAAAALPERVGVYRGEQIRNAAAIIHVGNRLGLDEHTQTLAVMTAMGESSLRNLDHGDKAGPDSRGLFQQRAGWGSYADRMNPEKSAEKFYAALQDVPNYHHLPPTIAAHKTQRNRNPQHYARWWDDARTMVQAIKGAADERH